MKGLRPGLRVGNDACVSLISWLLTSKEVRAEVWFQETGRRLEPGLPAAGEAFKAFPHPEEGEIPAVSALTLSLPGSGELEGVPGGDRSWWGTKNESPTPSTFGFCQQPRLDLAQLSAVGRPCPGPRLSSQLPRSVHSVGVMPDYHQLMRIPGLGPLPTRRNSLFMRNVSFRKEALCVSSFSHIQGLQLTGASFT